MRENEQDYRFLKEKLTQVRVRISLKQGERGKTKRGLVSSWFLSQLSERKLQLETVQEKSQS